MENYLQFHIEDLVPFQKPNQPETVKMDVLVINTRTTLPPHTYSKYSTRTKLSQKI